MFSAISQEKALSVVQGHATPRGIVINAHRSQIADRPGNVASLYAFFMPCARPRSRSFTALLGTIPLHAAIAVQRRNSMSVLDGVSLLLAVGLFVYLLVALLRADRN
jgi:K+-transporting ATPase ATPase F chain